MQIPRIGQDKGQNAWWVPPSVRLFLVYLRNNSCLKYWPGVAWYIGWAKAWKAWRRFWFFGRTSDRIGGSHHYTCVRTQSSEALEPYQSECGGIRYTALSCMLTPYEQPVTAFPSCPVYQEWENTWSLSPPVLYGTLRWCCDLVLLNYIRDSTRRTRDITTI